MHALILMLDRAASLSTKQVVVVSPTGSWTTWTNRRRLVAHISQINYFVDIHSVIFAVFNKLGSRTLRNIGLPLPASRLLQVSAFSSDTQLDVLINTCHHSKFRPPINLKTVIVKSLRMHAYMESSKIPSRWQRSCNVRGQQTNVRVPTSKFTRNEYERNLA